jgi:hypothetical protein
VHRAPVPEPRKPAQLRPAARPADQPRAPEAKKRREPAPPRRKAASSRGTAKAARSKRATSPKAAPARAQKRK